MIYYPSTAGGGMKELFRKVRTHSVASSLAVLVVTCVLLVNHGHQTKLILLGTIGLPLWSDAAVAGAQSSIQDQPS
jgi:hypothetical protein